MMTYKTPIYREVLLKLRRSENGQALVEVALTLPILLTCLLAAAEFAKIAYVAIEISNAAKAGVAYGAQSTSTAADTTGIQNATVLDASNIGLTTSGVTVTVAGVCSSGAACTGTGNTCKNTDCTTNAGDHIETIVAVDTSIAVTPAIHVPGLPASYTLKGHAKQICLP